MTLTRRTVLAGALALPAAGLAPAPAATRPDHLDRLDRLDRLDPDVAALETAYGVRVGFVAHDLASGRRLEHRPDARRPVLSVFKVLASAAVLRDLPPGDLQRRVRYDRADLVDYSPVTEQHLDDGMSIAALCRAALRHSDNTAGNLLLDQLGGPRAITRFARSIGDPVTRLDRRETALNQARPGDPRDTTSARATAGFLRALLVEEALDPRDRRRLRRWMLGNTTSAERFGRAMPPGWRLADKTGSGERGTANDAGVAWSPRGRPLVLAACTRPLDATRPARSEPLAALAELALARLTH